MCEKGDRIAGISASFIIGAALGAGLALLFAPASGEETRRRIRESASKAYEGGKEKMGEVVAKAKARMRHHGEEEAAEA